GGHFEMESGAHFKTEWGDQYNRNLHHIIELMKNTLNLATNFVYEQSLKHYVNYKDTIEENPTFPLRLGINLPPQTFYFEDKNQCKIDLIKFEFEIDVKFNPKINPDSGRIIKNPDDSIKAHSFKFTIDENTESEMILKPDSNFTFFHTSNSETVEFKTLASYDPKSNKITSS
ncbi:hypothetical protein, partial [Flavobacterium mesophilum]|uniref:hypothetical protein n=1 Tax=Flavobacterium mesophilum TaxID=3143495 RepID=UPI0031CEC37C